MNSEHFFHVRPDTDIRPGPLAVEPDRIVIIIGNLHLFLPVEAAETLQATIHGALMKAAAMRDAERIAA